MTRNDAQSGRPTNILLVVRQTISSMVEYALTLTHATIHQPQKILKKYNGMFTVPGWDMIVEGCDYLVADIREPKCDISCERRSNNVNEVADYKTKGWVQICRLRWVRYYCNAEKAERATSVIHSIIERTSSGARRMSSTLSRLETTIIQWDNIGILKIDRRCWNFSSDYSRIFQRTIITL